MPFNVKLSLVIQLLLLYSIESGEIPVTPPEPEPSPLPRLFQAQCVPQEDRSLDRPGEKKKADLNKKATAEPRPPNEPHTANVASATAPPPGLRVTPVGCEESEKVANVQVAPKILQPARLAQASDTGYGTGLSSRKKVGTGMYVCLRWLHEVSVFMQSFLPIRCVKVP